MGPADASTTDGTDSTAVPTIGVEEEFILVDRSTGHPVGRNREVAEAAARRGVRLDLELTTCQVEIATSACSTSRQVLAELRQLRSVVSAAAHEVGVGVIATGVPPTVPDAFPITDTERYRRIGEHFGMLAHEQGISGCHIHVGVVDRDVAVGVSNHLRRRLPVLLALSANSAIYRDADTGHASWRSVLWNRWPASGPPPHLRSRQHFEQLVDMFVSSGAILDDHMVYWDIRPSDHLPTVEVRIGDVQQSAADAAALATIVRALVMTATVDLAAGRAAPEIDAAVLSAALWKAAHDGIDGDGIDVLTQRPAAARDMAAGLIDDIDPSLGTLGDRDQITQYVARLARHGNGATRQRAQFSAHTRGSAVVEAAMRAFTE
ncbi:MULTISPECIES: glutamate--cysteine ligase [Gordonia]|uniref:Putative glutamate--cysteine ligase 2 n=1 Tax=Gordonia tangerina TaxID=2911060 RepID=A0ABS9DRS2_9ACTN|nr:glutamate--cysteine ligase [Gordonia tangerina]MCF3941334.1 glutamate--cysteine ligase [Gordonia tangerina]